MKSKEMVKEPAHSSFFLSGRLGRLLDLWQPTSDLVLMGTALFVGLFTGVGAILVQYSIRAVAWVGYTWWPSVTPGMGKGYVLVVPVIGGLGAGLLIYYLAREAKGHGVPEVMEAVAIRGGRIRPRVAVVKSLASALTIGSGGSAGREGPMVQIGSAIGSTVGQVLNLSDERIANLVACGAAAGISAAFNAPIAGTIFALEIVLSRFTARNFSTVVVSSVAASVVGRIAFGDSPAFRIPFEYGISSLWEFFFYLILGLLAAIVGVVFTRSLYWTEDFFDSMKRVPEWVKPAIGGALLGVLALTYPLIRLAQPVTWTQVPQVFNVGYDIIEQALANQILLGAAFVLLVAKIIATCLTLGSGASGGVFAPSMFMGAMLGTAFQMLIERFFPGLSAPAGAYALVAMAAVFAAAAHAPITSIIILFELTGDYRIILPLMLTVVVATLMAQFLLQGESIYTLKLTRRGIRLKRGRDVDILQSVKVGEVMVHDVATVPMDTTVGELSDIFAHTHHHGLMVLDANGKLLGVITLTDLERAVAEKRPKDTSTAEIATVWPNLQVAYPDETMGDALARMGSRGLGRLPVVSREDPYQLEGLIWRQAITDAYNLALTRRADIQEQTRDVQRQYEDGTGFIEIPLVAEDKVVGRTVASIAASLPKDCVLVSIHRNGGVIIPHGNTVLQAGDTISAFLSYDHADELFRSLHGPAQARLPAKE